MAASSLTPAEQAWLCVLEEEAERDLVLMWHITQGRFGGPRYNAEDVAPAFERMLEALLERGCKLGFDESNSSAWARPKGFGKTSKEQAAMLVALWKQDPLTWEWLGLVR